MRERLLAAAREFAIERGLDGASIREIADRAGVSSGMIAYYFGDRRGLHEAMFESAIVDLTGQFESALADLDTGQDLIDTLIRIHATALSANPWLARLLAREVLGRNTAFGNRFQEILEHPRSLARDAIAREIERGRLRSDLEPEMCFLTIVSMSAFTYLSGPALSDSLGFRLDDEFRDRLIEHNREVLAKGMRAPTSERECKKASG